MSHSGLVPVAGMIGGARLTRDDQQEFGISRFVAINVVLCRNWRTRIMMILTQALVNSNHPCQATPNPTLQVGAREMGGQISPERCFAVQLT